MQFRSFAEKIKYHYSEVYEEGGYHLLQRSFKRLPTWMEGGQEDEQPEVPGGDQDQEGDHEARQEDDHPLQPPPKRLCLEYFGALEAISCENSR